MVLRTYFTSSDITCSNCISTTESSNTYTTNSYYDYKKEKYENIKKILKLQMILEMKSKWTSFQLLFKFKPLRPSIQLRGVCFGGRGWA